MELYCGNIYRYFDDKTNQEELCVYMCDTNLKNKICIIPVLEAGEGGEFKLEGLNKAAYPNEWKEIYRSQIHNVLMLKGKIAKVTFDEYVQLSDIIFSKLIEKLHSTYKSFSENRLKSSTKKYGLTEDFYKYITWFEHKSNLQFNRVIKKQPGIIKYGIYYIEIGENIGSELHKLRPAVIFKKCQSNKSPNDSSYVVIPITSKHTSSKYSFNTPIIINGKISYIRINDIRRVSIKRILSPLYDKNNNIIKLSEEDQNRLKQDFKAYFIGVDE